MSSLFLICAPYCFATRILPLFEQSGYGLQSMTSTEPVKLSEHTTVVLVDGGNPETLTRIAKIYPDAPCLLLYTSLEDALGEAMRLGTPPKAAIDTWTVAIDRFLKMHRRNRRRVLLANLAQISATPEDFTGLMSHVEGINLRNSDFVATEGTTKPDLYQMLAKTIVRQEFSLAPLMTDLETCSLPMPKTSQEWIDPDLAYAAINSKHVEQDRLKAELREVSAAKDDSEQENVLLLQQLHQIQQELETVFQREENLSRDLLNTRAEQDRLKVELSEVSTAKDEALQENILLLQQLHQVQEELEHYFLRCREFEQNEQKRVQHVPVEIPKRVPKRRLRELFDADWYNKQAGKQLFPLRHYLTKGWEKGLSPHPLFDPQYYRESNQLTDLSVCPLLHFFFGGYRNGYAPHPLFDVKWYMQQYADVQNDAINPVVHYLKYGEKEGRKPSPKFDSSLYLGRYPDVAQAGFNALVHYVKFGMKEGRMQR